MGCFRKSVHFSCLLTVLSAPAGTHAQAVATCANLKGYAHYHYAGVVPKNKSGFTDDAITGGITTLQRLADGTYDVLVLDTRRELMSMKHDGGSVVLLRRGSSDATFLVAFPSGSIDLYSFYKDGDGLARFDLLSSKGGDRMPIHKSSVMTGICQHLDLSLIK